MPHERPLVLIADNNRDNREMYAEYLRACGFRVLACSDSEMSVSLARQCHPDIILLELRMNRMNGFEALARMKVEPSLMAVPVVALTASVLDTEQAAAREAGFVEVLAKPCFPENVAAAITRLLAPPPAEVVPRPQAAAAHNQLGAGQRIERRTRRTPSAPVSTMPARGVLPTPSPR